MIYAGEKWSPPMTAHPVGGGMVAKGLGADPQSDADERVKRGLAKLR